MMHQNIFNESRQAIQAALVAMSKKRETSTEAIRKQAIQAALENEKRNQRRSNPGRDYQHKKEIEQIDTMLLTNGTATEQATMAMPAITPDQFLPPLPEIAWQESPVIEPEPIISASHPFHRVTTYETHGCTPQMLVAGCIQRHIDQYGVLPKRINLHSLNIIMLQFSGIEDYYTADGQNIALVTQPSIDMDTAIAVSE